MLRNAPLFKGDCEISQLFCIFQILGNLSKTFKIAGILIIISFQGTPNETLWPGVSVLPNYTSNFPQWQPTSTLSKYVHLPSAKAEDILTCCLYYLPEQRLTAKQALQHPYFAQDGE